MAWPSQLALELLAELEEDPRDCGHIDLDEMLEAWEIVEILPGQGQIGYRTRAHRSAPNYFFHYPLKLELSPATIRRICTSVRTLHRILDP